MNSPDPATTDRERLRLSALDSFGVLDTPREGDFDDIARLASDICGTPIAVINLIGSDRQFFKAEVGLGVRETPLDSSFCAKAILEEDFLIVPDATQDQRFNCNPLVTGEPHLRFYAGALLKTDDGLPIGTVCVLDFQPRALTEVQMRTLRVLARQVMVQLELKRALRAQARQLEAERRRTARRIERAEMLDVANRQVLIEERRSREAQGVGGIGVFEVEVRSGTMEVNDEFCRIFGLPLQNTYPASVFEELIVPSDKEKASTPQTRATGSSALNVEYQIVRGDDRELRWVARRAQFMRDAAGNVARMVGVVIDITDAKLRGVRVTGLLALGDQLREANSIEAAAKIAADVLMHGLDVERSGFATIDRTGESFTVVYDNVVAGVASIAGRHSLSEFSATVGKLSDGRVLVVPDIGACPKLAADAASFDVLDVQALVAVPVIERSELVGALFVHSAEVRDWSADEEEFIRGVADRAQAAFGKIRAEADQSVLNEELVHRLKNTLAMVQAIANQTLRGVTAPAALDGFAQRLLALSAAHDVLLQQSWLSARMRDVMERVLSIHGHASRITMQGPNVLLGPRAVISLSMLLHELATNAVKHGALSGMHGVVLLSWKLTDQQDEEWLTLSWREMGGPPVVEPLTKGFGSRLIRMGLAGAGDVDKRYEPEGFVAIFTAPLKVLQSS